MSGEQFMHRIGGVSREWDHVTGKYNFELLELAKFGRVAGKLRVISRATPEHKLAFITGIKQL